MVDSFVALPFAWTRIFTPTLLELAIAYALLALWLLRPVAARFAPPETDGGAAPLSRLGWRIAAAATLFLALAADAAWWTYDRFLDPRLRVTILSVGEGDAAVVRFPRGRVMVIDGGGAFGESTIGDLVLGPYLWSEKIMSVDYLALTHPDYDHFAGLEFIAANFRPVEFWATSASTPARSYAGLLATLAASGARLRLISEAPGRFAIDAVGIDVLTAGPPEALSRNNGSIVLRLGFQGASMLFTGDIEARAERLLLARAIDLRATVLKVPHHGSASSSTTGFIEAVDPALAVISVGYGNRFGFPSPRLLDRYRARGIDVFRTDLDGAVAITIDGGNVAVTAFRGRSARVGAGNAP
jgi:competence protein ComEC